MIKDGVLYSKNGKKICMYPPGKEGNFVITEGIEIIGREAFWQNLNITKIEIPDTVKTIGSCALENCKKIVEINYMGTTEMWNTIVKDRLWCNAVNTTEIKCQNGTVTL